MQLDIVVAAHPDRKEMALKLSDDVRASAIVWDEGLGSRDTHERAWRWLAEVHPGSSHWSMVIEDDAIPCYRFRHCLAESLKVAPGPVVNAYLGRGRPVDWQHSIAKVMATRNADWLVVRHVLNGVGMAVRGDYVDDLTAFVSPLRQYASTRLRRLREPMDEAMTRWVNTRKLPVAYHHPSLLDHDPDLPSIIGPDRPRPPVEVPARLLAGATDADMDYRKAWWCESKDEWGNTMAVIPRP